MTRIPALVALGSTCLLGLLFTGCATITRGTSEVLVVESEPSGATVRLSNGMVGTTPTSFKIHRKGAVTVSIFKEGYQSAEINVNTQVASGGAAGMAGNVLVGGLIGVGVDSFSGGMLEHKPNPVKVTLVALPPKTPVPPAPPGPPEAVREPVAVAGASPGPEAPTVPAAPSEPAAAVTAPADPVDPAGPPPPGEAPPPAANPVGDDAVAQEAGTGAPAGTPHA